MPRLNSFQWRSENGHVGAEQLRGGVSIRVGNEVSYMGHNLTVAEADDLARFIIDCGIAERAAGGTQNGDEQ